MHYFNVILFLIAIAVVALVVIATAIVAPFNILNILLLLFRPITILSYYNFKYCPIAFFNVALINLALI